MKRLLALLLVILLAACSIVQEVRPVAPADVAAKGICVVENPEVRKTFLEAYKHTLEKKGFAVKVLPPGTAITECPVYTTYDASWLWDLVSYMAYAEINIYRDGKIAGKALYDSRMGGARIIDKFIKTDAKISELVDQLFPD
jgi:hypothetical protein